MIPNQFFFIYLYGDKTYPFGLSHYLSLCSNIEVNNPDRVYVVTNDIRRLKTETLYFSLAYSKYEVIQLLDISDLDGFTELYPMFDSIPYMAHKSDLLRMYLISEFGGIYSDFDSIALSPLPKEYFDSDKSIFCSEDVDGVPSGICVGFFLGVPDCEFIKSNLGKYIDYDPSTCMPGTPTWSKYAVQAMWEDYKLDPSRIRLIEAKKFQPIYLDYSSVQDLFFLNKYEEIKDNYQLHLWETRNGLILRSCTEKAISELSTTYTLSVKKYLS